MAYGVCNIAKRKGTDFVYSFTSADPLENGQVVFKGDLVSGEKEIYNAVKPTTSALTSSAAYLIKSPEILYDESSYSKYQLNAFRNEANEISRGYELTKGTIFEVSYDVVTLLSTDATVGNYLIPQNNSYDWAEATAIGTSKFAAKIIEVITIGTLQYVGSNGQVGNQYKKVVVEVVQN